MNRRGFFAILAAAIAPRASTNRWGGIKAYWLDECTPSSRWWATPSVRLVDLRLKKLGSLVRVTDKLLADSQSIADIRLKEEECQPVDLGKSLRECFPATRKELP